MVEVCGRPILAYHVDWLRLNGVSHVTFLCGYLHEVIADYFGDGAGVGLKMDYLVEETPLGRGGAIRRGLEALPGDVQEVIATNGDVLTTQPLAPMLELHRSKAGAMATLLLAPLWSSFGVVDVSEEGTIRGFEEKPRLPYWINGGIYVLSRGITEWLPKVGDHETETFPLLAAQHRLLGLRCGGFWRAVDTAKDLREVGEAVGQGLLA